MENLFIILLLFSLTSLGVGLINPKVFSRFLKEKATRKNLALLFSGLTILFFILFAMTAPPTGKESSYTLDSETQLNNLETDEESLNDAESLQENNLEESLQETSQPSNSTPPPTDTGSSSTTQETQSPQNSPPQQEQKFITQVHTIPLSTITQNLVLAGKA